MQPAARSRAAALPRGVRARRSGSRRRSAPSCSGCTSGASASARCRRGSGRRAGDRRSRRRSPPRSSRARRDDRGGDRRLERRSPARRPLPRRQRADALAPDVHPLQLGALRRRDPLLRARAPRGSAAARLLAAGCIYTSAMASKNDVLEALRQVEDPELGMDIVDLGLVYEVEMEGPKAKVIYSLTSMGCPAGPLIAQDIDRTALEVPGVEEVELELVFDPPWTPDRMSDDAKFILGFG